MLLSCVECHDSRKIILCQLLKYFSNIWTWLMQMSWYLLHKGKHSKILQKALLFFNAFMPLISFVSTCTMSLLGLMNPATISNTSTFSKHSEPCEGNQCRSQTVTALVAWPPGTRFINFHKSALLAHYFS